MDVRWLHVEKTANIYILQFNFFFSNIFILSIMEVIISHKWKDLEKSVETKSFLKFNIQISIDFHIVPL